MTDGNLSWRFNRSLPPGARDLFVRPQDQPPEDRRISLVRPKHKFVPIDLTTALHHLKSDFLGAKFIRERSAKAYEWQLEIVSDAEGGLELSLISRKPELVTYPDESKWKSFANSYIGGLYPEGHLKRMTGMLLAEQTVTSVSIENSLALNIGFSGGSVWRFRDDRADALAETNATTTQQGWKVMGHSSVRGLRIELFTEKGELLVPVRRS